MTATLTARRPVRELSTDQALSAEVAQGNPRNPFFHTLNITPRMPLNARVLSTSARFASRASRSALARRLRPGLSDERSVDIRRAGRGGDYLVCEWLRRENSVLLRYAYVGPDVTEALESANAALLAMTADGYRHAQEAVLHTFGCPEPQLNAGQEFTFFGLAL